MASISIVTVNIEHGKKSPIKIKEKSDIITNNNPDIIFIQESNKNSINLDNYNYINYSPNKGYIDIFLRKNSDWKQYYITSFNTKYSYTMRTCKIIFVKNINTKKIIKLANIHLCGGRFDENDKIGGMLLGNIKDIHERKNEILKELINIYDIDIVAGDFNSDLICYIQDELLQHHLEYFKKISPKTSINIFKEWNIAPYKYLESNNYTLALDKSKIKYTSMFKTHPDSIWFKNGKQLDYKYVKLIKHNLSDHNGIYSKIIIN